MKNLPKLLDYPLIRALDLPLCFTGGMILASLVNWKNIIARDYLSFALCFVGMWVFSYLVKWYQRTRAKNSEQDLNDEAQ